MKPRRAGRSGNVREKLISRCLGYGQHGWIVRIKRWGRPLIRYFADAHYGGAQGSLKVAIRHRDWLLRRLPPGRRFRHFSSRNTSGVIGVHATATRRGGRVRKIYVASWRDERGRPRTRAFSVSRYGERGSKARAVRLRLEMLERYAGPQDIDLDALIRSLRKH